MSLELVPAPETAAAVRAALLADYPATDLGNAERFAAACVSRLRYCPTQGQWYRWTGTRWRADDTRHAERLAQEVVREIYQQVPHVADATQRRALARWAAQSEGYARLKALVDLAGSQITLVVRVADLDADPWLLATPDGTVDLRTGSLRPAEREDLLTHSTGVSLHPDATAPRWDRFLAQVLPDPDVRAYLQRAAGYSLTGRVSEQALLFLHGTGANGKSVFLNTLRAVWGDYAALIPSELLVAPTDDASAQSRATLQGLRLAQSVETEDGRRLREATVKAITSAEPILARRLYHDMYAFTPTHTLWLASNHRPLVRGTDIGLWRRIHLVPWTVTIPDTDQIPDLEQHLVATEGPGILAWAVQGCLAWQQTRLCAPPAVRAAVDQYRASQDVLGAFLDDRCAAVPGWREVRVGELYNALCAAEGEKPGGIRSARDLGERLRERGIDIEKRGTKSYIVGYKLMTVENEPSYS